MSKSIEEIAKDTCEFEVGCTVCGDSKETRHTERACDTDVTTKIRNAYPISTFTGATQDELVECVRSIVVGVLNELDSLSEDHTVAGDGDRSVHVRHLQTMKERWMI